jgi:hypothetical protein
MEKVLVLDNDHTLLNVIYLQFIGIMSVNNF